MLDFNDVSSTSTITGPDLIPPGTAAKVILHLLPGGYSDPAQGIEGGIATKNESTGSIYLKCEYVVMGGQYDKRKIFGFIGLHSEKGDAWKEMGKKFVRDILNSAHNLRDNDNSEEACAKRRLAGGYKDLDGLIFAARIGIENNATGNEKNVIKQAIVPPYPAYITLMSPSDLFSESLNLSRAPKLGEPEWVR